MSFYKLSPTYTIELADAALRDGTFQSYGASVCLANILGILPVNSDGCTVCLPETLNLLPINSDGCTICLPGTLDLLAINSYGVTIGLNVSMICQVNILNGPLNNILSGSPFNYLNCM